MNRTVHGTTNFKALLPYLTVLNNAQDECGCAWRRFTSQGYMDLSMEKLGYTDHRGRPVYYMAHYGEQNGDLMADPEIRFSVDFSAGIVEPLEFRNDYMGVYQQVYISRDGQLLYSRQLRTDLDAFMWQWTKNLADQGFTPERTAA